MNQLSSMNIVVFALLLLVALACSAERTPPRSLRDPSLAATYDRDRQLTVLFGSRDGEPGNQTFELGAAGGFLQRASDGLAAREGHALAFDSTRSVTTLFGGFRGFGVYDGETWEWDGTRWTQVATTGPSPRYSPGMAFDPLRGQTVLFGGRTAGGLSNETWLWDGATWTQSFASGPTFRNRHAMVFDSSRGLTVLFGGYGGGGSSAGKPTNDTYEWDGLGWTRRDPATLPSRRSLHAMAFDALRGVSVLFGGHDGAFDGETWEWDGVDWALRATSGPSPRVNPAMAFDEQLGVTILAGGFDGNDHLDDLWHWDGTTWARRAAAAAGGPPTHDDWVIYRFEPIDPVR